MTMISKKLRYDDCIMNGYFNLDMKNVSEISGELEIVSLDCDV